MLTAAHDIGLPPVRTADEGGVGEAVGLGVLGGLIALLGIFVIWRFRTEQQSRSEKIAKMRFVGCGPYLAHSCNSSCVSS